MWRSSGRLCSRYIFRSFQRSMHVTSKNVATSSSPSFVNSAAVFADSIYQVSQKDDGINKLCVSLNLYNENLNAFPESEMQRLWWFLQTYFNDFSYNDFHSLFGDLSQSVIDNLLSDERCAHGLKYFNAAGYDSCSNTSVMAENEKITSTKAHQSRRTQLRRSRYRNSLSLIGRHINTFKVKLKSNTHLHDYSTEGTADAGPLATLPTSNHSSLAFIVQTRTLNSSSPSGFQQLSASPEKPFANVPIPSENPFTKNEKEKRKDEKKGGVASVENLKTLTKNRDIDSLLKVLNEQTWPPYRCLKAFIAETFQLLITGCELLDDVQMIVYDFATANNRACLPTAVILSLLTRIVEEQSVGAAVAYARRYRTMFLVKPPMNDYFTLDSAVVTENLFGVAFATEQNSQSDVKELCDTLIELGYLRDSSAFLCAAVNDCLKRNDFNSAYQMWTSNSHKYRVGDGSHILINELICNKNYTDAFREKNLCGVLRCFEEFGNVFDGLSEIIIELIRCDRESDAQSILAKIKISGQHFVKPLHRLKNEKNGLITVEKFSSQLSLSLLNQNNGRKSKKLKQPMESISKTIDKTQPIAERRAQRYVEFLLSNWHRSHKRRRSAEKKKFLADANQVEHLIRTLQRLWFQMATSSNDADSLLRLGVWCSKHGFELPENLRNAMEQRSTKTEAAGQHSIT